MVLPAFFALATERDPIEAPGASQGTATCRPVEPRPALFVVAPGAGVASPVEQHPS